MFYKYALFYYAKYLYTVICCLYAYGVLTTFTIEIYAVSVFEKVFLSVENMPYSIMWKSVKIREQVFLIPVVFRAFCLLLFDFSVFDTDLVCRRTL